MRERVMRSCMMFIALNNTSNRPGWASSAAGCKALPASGAASLASGASSLVSQQADPLASALDTVMRSNGATPPTQGEREEASRILVRSLANGSLEAGDREYIASRMATRMNIPQAEAEKRIDDAYARLNQAKETAKQAAEKARRILGFQGGEDPRQYWHQS